MAIGISNYESREYITKNPIRSSVGAIGYGTVQTINLAVDTINLSRSIVELAQYSINESIIEAKRDSKLAELNAMDDLADLEAQIKAKKAKLTKA